jgi:xylulokinase
VDLGTSSVKVAVFDAQGGIKGTSTKRYSLELGESGKAEQDPGGWWTAMSEALREVFSSGSGFDVKGIGFTGQWSGTVPIDAEGNVLHNAIIWMDTRGKDVIEKLTSGFPSISGYRIDKLYTWLRKTGGAPAHSGKDSLAHILYIKENLPDVYRGTHKFMEPKDYLIMRLTGVCKASWDNTALLWATDNRDPSNVKYDDGLLRMAGLDRQKLPDLVAPTEVVGTVTSRAAGETGIPEGTKVVSGCGDMQGSLVGAGCVEDYLAHLYVGTSSWVIAHVPFKKTDIFHNIASLPSGIPGRYFIAAEQENAANALEFMCSNLNIPPQNKYEEIAQMVSSSPPGAKRLIFLPWLFGERAPVEDPNARGGLFNLSLGHGRNDIVRAVMEGVAYNTKWLLSVVDSFIGTRGGGRNRGIVMSGGASLSQVWPQIFSDVLERELTLIDNPIYSTAKGAAMLAAVGTQVLTLEQLKGMKAVGRVVRPQKEGSGAYREGYRQFLQYYKSNKKGMKEYNRSV